MTNTTYYFSRIFEELFDLQVRLMAIEGTQGLDYEDGKLVLDKNKNVETEEVMYKSDFDQFVFWLLAL